MVRLTKIYTRLGDGGETHLGDMSRTSKADARVAAFGDVDETNSAIGVAVTHDLPAGIGAKLTRIQNDLFDLGADLATPDRGKPVAWEPLRILQSQVDRLEQEIDLLNGELSPLTSFVLPGGSPAAATLHQARTVCRRAERGCVALAGHPDEPVSAAAVKYLNRLSDLLFVAARWANDKGAADVLWVPGANR